MIPINRLKRWPYPGNPVPNDRIPKSTGERSNTAKPPKKPPTEKGTDGGNQNN
jgi:hypothetical protein